MRKNNKLHANGEAPRIDMETLRASARAADLADKPRSKQAPRAQQSVEPASPPDVGKPLPQQHHQGSFQVVTMAPQELTLTPAHPDATRVRSQQPLQAMPQNPSSMSAPPPPWATSTPSSVTGARGYAPDQLQHQSFMRTSQNSVANTTSPR